MAHTHIIGQQYDALVLSHIFNDISYRTLQTDNPRKVFVLDPNGHAVDWLLPRLPKKRNPIIFDPRTPIAWNPLDTPDDPPAVASSIVDTFRAINGYDISANLFNKALYSAVAALLEYGGTLFETKYLFLSETFRKRVLESVTNPVIKRFWQKEFLDLSPRERAELVRSAETTMHILISDPRIAALLAHKKSKINLAQIDVLLAIIPQGNFGIQRSATVGSLLLGQLLSTIQRQPYNHLSIYVLDAHYFAPTTLIEFLTTAQKYGAEVTLAHQNLSQLDYRLKDALLGNCETRHVFRVSLKDADELESLELHDNTNARLNELPPGCYRTYPIEDKRQPDFWADWPHVMANPRTTQRVLQGQRQYQSTIDLKKLVEGMQ